MSYTYHRPLVIDHLQVSSDLVDFPVLVSLTTPSFKTVANGGALQSASGYDLAFFTDEGLTTQLDHEVLAWNGTTGVLLAFVRVPSVSASLDTVFYVGYGDAAIVTPQTNPSGVWGSGYALGGVWHCGDNAASTAILDSASGAHHATNIANTSGKTTPGKFGSALTYNGSSDAASVALNLSTAPTITISCWLSWDSFADNDHLLSEFSTNYNTPTGVFLLNPNSTGGAGLSGGGFDANMNNGPSTHHFMRKCARPSAATFHFYSFHFTGGGSPSTRILVDGVAQALTAGDSFAQQATFASSTLYWMSRATSSLFGAGKLHEYRVYIGDRSNAWMATEYANQSSPSTFLTLGSEGLSLVSVTPNTGARPTTLTVAILGNATHFDGTTTVDVGADITINSVTVTAATHLSVSLTIGITAALGARDVTVTTGAEVATGLGIFTVTVEQARRLTQQEFEVPIGRRVPIYLTQQKAEVVVGRRVPLYLTVQHWEVLAVVRPRPPIGCVQADLTMAASGPAGGCSTGTPLPTVDPPGGGCVGQLD